MTEQEAIEMLGEIIAAFGAERTTAFMRAMGDGIAKEAATRLVAELEASWGDA